jgi:hypothetical protein
MGEGKKQFCLIRLVAMQMFEGLNFFQMNRTFVILLFHETIFNRLSSFVSAKGRNQESNRTKRDGNQFD